MTVPVYTVIADAELDPEAPLTSSLMYRLRNNLCAILGIDPADTSPSFTLPASTAAIVADDCFFAQGTLGTARTTSDIVVSTIAEDNEDIQIQSFTIQKTVNGASVFNGAGLCGNLFMYTTEGGVQGPIVATITGIAVEYAAAVPTGVTIYWVNENAAAGTPVTLPLDNAYHNVVVHTFASDFFYLLGKARATSTEVFLQFKIDAHSSGSPSAYQGAIVIPFVLKSFLAKA